MVGDTSRIWPSKSKVMNITGRPDVEQYEMLPSSGWHPPALVVPRNKGSGFHQCEIMSIIGLSKQERPRHLRQLGRQQSHKKEVKNKYPLCCHSL